MTDQTIPVDKLRALLDQFQWEGLTRDGLHHVSAAGVLKEVRDLLPDPPLPDPLFGARATHPEHGEGIVGSDHADKEGEVRFMFPNETTDDGTSFRWVSPSALTFHTPDHPKFLETEEDYRSAPQGTIVAKDERRPFVLIAYEWRCTGSALRFSHKGMAGTRRRVLRWGWEA